MTDPPLALALLATTAHARGVSPYLPVDISPEIERKIERVLILAEQPALKRPIAAATVLDVLPRACERDAALCDDVRRYLEDAGAGARSERDPSLDRSTADAGQCGRFLGEGIDVGRLLRERATKRPTCTLG